MSAPRIAVQLYTLRHELARDLDGTIARIATLGVAGVEVVAGDVDPTRLRTLLDAHGLAVCGAHGVLPEGPGAEAVLDEQAALGSDLLIVSALGGLSGAGNGDLDDPAGLDRIVARFDAAAQVAAARGVRVGYHNHWWEWDAGGAGYAAFWERVDPRVVAEVDAYWAQVAGQDPADLLTTLGSRAELLHLKDGPLRTDSPMVALGQGRADVAGAVAAGRHARWHVIELDDCAGDVFAAVAESVRWLTA